MKVILLKTFQKLDYPQKGQRVKYISDRKNFQDVPDELIKSLGLKMGINGDILTEDVINSNDDLKARFANAWARMKALGISQKAPEPVKTEAKVK